VCGVSNLQALAWFGARDLRAPVIDARRGEVYAGLYSADLTPLTEEVVLPPERWSEWLPQQEVELIAADFGCVAGVVVGSRLEACPRTLAPKALAAAVGRIAWRRLLRGEVTKPAELQANYVRRSDAELYSAPD
jgi:tRNA threonylcarbamoyladenosine biosynthesis protein TsaB